jgi:hypothetical protein
MLIRAVFQHEQPLTASQPGSINGMQSQRLDITVHHGHTPLGSVVFDEWPELVFHDDVAGFVNCGLPPILFRCTGP